MHLSWLLEVVSVPLEYWINMQLQMVVHYLKEFSMCK